MSLAAAAPPLRWTTPFLGVPLSPPSTRKACARCLSCFSFDVVSPPPSPNSSLYLPLRARALSCFSPVRFYACFPPRPHGVGACVYTTCSLSILSFPFAYIYIYIYMVWHLAMNAHLSLIRLLPAPAWSCHFGFSLSPYVAGHVCRHHHHSPSSSLSVSPRR